MITIGVDAHKQIHVAVAVDEAGCQIGLWRGRNTPAGWRAAECWAAQLGEMRQWGIEGAWSYGRGLAQHLVQSHEVVYEVNTRWTALGRRSARKPDKTDALDARAIALFLRQEPAALPRVRFVDPSGLDATIFCGTGQQCQEGNKDDLGSFRSWVEQYWMQHEHIFGGMEDYAFGMLEIVLAQGWSASRTLSAFHIAFVDTTDSIYTDIRLGAAERLPFYGDGLEHWENEFWNDVLPQTVRPIDTLIGYSAGGSVVERILEHASHHHYHADAAILIQPANHVHYPGIHATGFSTSLTANEVPGTRIITLNEDDSVVHGTVTGAVDFETADMCSGNNHCDESGMAAFGIWASMQPVGLGGDQRIAGFMPLDVSMGYGS